MNGTPESTGFTCELRPGAVVGQYRVIEKIGQGGMGAVFRAKQLSIDRVVALKVLPPQLAADKLFVERFLREAKSAGRCTHRNLIAVYDCGFADGYYYYSMEFVPGWSLRDRLQQMGPLDEATARRYLRQVAEALQVAHQTGVVHRDIKPDNILIDAEDNARLADLGLARLTDERSDLTHAGTTVGTPRYMPPEQVRGEDADARADIYGLGATFHHLLSGRLLFDAASTTMMGIKHLTEPPTPIRQLRPELTPGIERLLLRCLEKEPAQRFQSCGDLIAEIDGLEPVPGTGSMVKKVLKASLGDETEPTAAAAPADPLVPTARAPAAEQPGSPSRAGSAARRGDAARGGTTTIRRGATRVGGTSTIRRSDLRAREAAGRGNGAFVVAAVLAALVMGGGLVLALRPSAPSAPPTAPPTPQARQPEAAAPGEQRVAQAVRPPGDRAGELLAQARALRSADAGDGEGFLRLLNAAAEAEGASAGAAREELARLRAESAAAQSRERWARTAREADALLAARDFDAVLRATAAFDAAQRAAIGDAIEALERRARAAAGEEIDGHARRAEAALEARDAEAAEGALAAARAVACRDAQSAARTRLDAMDRRVAALRAARSGDVRAALRAALDDLLAGRDAVARERLRSAAAADPADAGLTAATAVLDALDARRRALREHLAAQVGQRVAVVAADGRHAGRVARADADGLRLDISEDPAAVAQKAVGWAALLDVEPSPWKPQSSADQVALALLCARRGDAARVGAALDAAGAHPLGDLLAERQRAQPSPPPAAPDAGGAKAWAALAARAPQAQRDRQAAAQLARDIERFVADPAAAAWLAANRAEVDAVRAQLAGIADPFAAGLVAHWRMDERQGAQAADSGPNAIALAAVGTEWIQGPLGGALRFTAPNAGVEGPDSPALDDADQLSVAFWFQLDRLPKPPRSYFPLVAKREVPPELSWAIHVLPSHRVSAYVNARDRIATGATTLVAGRWYHLALVFDGRQPGESRLRLLLDGQPEGAAAPLGTRVVRSGARIRMGHYPDAPDHLAGSLDDVRVYRRALEEGEVRGLVELRGKR